VAEGAGCAGVHHPCRVACFVRLSFLVIRMFFRGSQVTGTEVLYLFFFFCGTRD
jgi:hypothetical protein